MGFLYRGVPMVVDTALAAGDKVTSPTAAAPNRYVYYPGTEELGQEEIRVVACGTGMPASRRGQAATCFLVECGNGDKFLFDIGTGSMANVAALMIPYQYLDKVFLSHLHTDHFGDLDALWAGGWTAGRPNALRVWGPSGEKPELGTAHAMKYFLEAYKWDYETRAAKIGYTPGRIECTEFDYKGINQIVYDENGVVIRSTPAIHTGDGSVSYSLEYAGLKFVFGGDTEPNKWFPELAKGGDLVIHECMHTPEQFMTFYNQPPELAWNTCGGFHTSPPMFGKIMSMVKPRHAVAYHFFNEEGTRYAIYDAIRTTYDGPLSMATDNMVWNITKDEVRERMAVSPAAAWSVPGTAVQKIKPSGWKPISDFIRSGYLEKETIEGQGDLMRAFWKKYNVQIPPEIRKAYGVE
jgi:ribonuclease Z